MFDNVFQSSLLMYLWLIAGVLVSLWLLLAPRWRYRPWRSQRVGGVLTAAVGTMFLILALFLPMWTVSEVRAGETITNTESMWQRGIEPEIAVMLALLVTLATGFGIAAVLDSRQPKRPTLYALWGATGFLFVVSVVTGFSIGLILFPVAMLALATSIQATRHHEHWSVTESEKQPGGSY